MQLITLLVQCLFTAPLVFCQCVTSKPLGVPLITLEEHFIPQAFAAYPPLQPRYASPLDFPSQYVPPLLSLGNQRLQDMNLGQVTMQVISTTPPSHAPLDVCQAANNQLAGAVRNNTQRYAGFATLPMQQPSDAVTELRRCVKDLGFVGALIDNHIEGQFYDNSSFWPVFAAAQDLDVPIYIHPTQPTQAMLASTYNGNYSAAAAEALGTYEWGWHADTGLHFFRLYASGFFDAFPRVKIIIGHMGEMIPFQLGRSFANAGVFYGHNRTIQQVWDENIWITTSGFFTLPPLQCALQVTKMDRIMYSVDYPWSNTTLGLKFMQDVQSSGLLSKTQFEMLAYKNAESLLKIQVQ